MEGSQDQKLRLIRKSFFRGRNGFTVARDVPWIAEPQLRYQLELELVSGMSESMQLDIRKDFATRGATKRYRLVANAYEKTLDYKGLKVYT